jgi:hypothetical protein
MSDAIPPRPQEEHELDPLTALLGDLHALSDYLHGRSRQTYEMATRFAAAARRDADARAYDERQATMLEYQHHIWNEIAGLVDRLVVRYSAPEDDAEDDAAEVE